MKEGLIQELKGIKDFFERSTDCLTEKDSGFAPKENMYTVSHHVAHVAQTVNWFIDGMFNPDGFDMDFEKHIREAMSCNSLGTAREWFSKAIADAIEVIGTKSDEELGATIAEGPIMGGAPRFVAIGAISEHSAHHRGALTVYSRLLGYAPKMPYGEM